MNIDPSSPDYRARVILAERRVLSELGLSLHDARTLVRSTVTEGAFYVVRALGGVDQAAERIAHLDQRIMRQFGADAMEWQLAFLDALQPYKNAVEQLRDHYAVEEAVANLAPTLPELAP